MKRVIIIGADFSPSSFPPALRIRFFAQHLPDFGWQPIVLTTDPQYYEWPVDLENERLLPETIEVIRTPALSARLTRKIGIGDIGMRSLWYHWGELSKLCKKRHIDLVFIPVPPYMPMVLGRLVYQRFAIPYVIDYIDPWIDPWVTEYYWKLPKKQRPPKWAMAYIMSRILEPFALRHVSHIVGVSKGTNDSVIARYQWLTEADASEIPYGGEPADFDYMRWNPRRNIVFNRSDGLFHVSYIGVCIPAMHATVRALFNAVRLCLQRSPEIISRLRMHFIGTTYAPNADGLYQVLPIAREMGLQDLVDEHPARISYLDALQILMDSTALVVIGSEDPHYTASKIFPYIMARKPLLAVFHEDSSVVTILRETNAGEVVTFNSKYPPAIQVDKISKLMEEILSLPRDYQPQTLWEAFESYTTRAMARQLAYLFDNIVSKSHR